MNTTFALASVFAAVSGFAGLANTASAGTDIHVNLGIFGRPAPVVVAPVRCAPAPVYGYGYVRAEPVREVCPAPEPRGYWREVAVKVWVPEEFVVTRDRFGREFRSVRAGYFTYRNDRVWVAEVAPRGGYSYARR